MYPLQKNALNKQFQRIVCQNNSAKIYSEKISAVHVCHAVFFRLCTDPIPPPVTVEVCQMHVCNTWFKLHWIHCVFGGSVLRQDTSEPGPNIGETQEIHE